MKDKLLVFKARKQAAKTRQSLSQGVDASNRRKSNGVPSVLASKSTAPRGLSVGKASAAAIGPPVGDAAARKAPATVITDGVECELESLPVLVMEAENEEERVKEKAPDSSTSYAMECDTLEATSDQEHEHNQEKYSQSYVYAATTTSIPCGQSAKENDVYNVPKPSELATELKSSLKRVSHEEKSSQAAMAPAKVSNTYRKRSVLVNFTSSATKAPRTGEKQPRLKRRDTPVGKGLQIMNDEDDDEEDSSPLQCYGSYFVADNSMETCTPVRKSLRLSGIQAPLR